MALTLGTTGMDHDTELDVVAAFKIANAETGQHWSLATADAADYVIIDLDSLYGPISWLRLHGLGHKVIALTAKERCDADYRLPRPISAVSMAVLLSEIATDAALPPAAVPEAEVALEAEPDAAPAPTLTLESIPEPAPEPALDLDPMAEPAPAPELEPAPEPAAPIALPLRHWLQAGRLQQPVRLAHASAPALLIDPLRGLWHGPAALKPLAAHFETALQETDFDAPAADAWTAEAAALGPAQPLARLQWLGGLLSGSPAPARYQLSKWPQTEREYPKHFRIATVMMKGPASVAEIAAASHVEEAEVTAFVNANLATGYAEAVPESAPADAAAPRPQGLLERIRGH